MTIFAGTLLSMVDWMRDNLLDASGAFFAAKTARAVDKMGNIICGGGSKKKLLSQDSTFCKTLFGLDTNIENRWNLHRHDSYRSVVERLSLTSTQADAVGVGETEDARSCGSRHPADIDRKVITGWNGLAIKGLADAGRSTIKANGLPWQANARNSAPIWDGRYCTAPGMSHGSVIRLFERLR